MQSKRNKLSGAAEDVRIKMS